MKATPIPRTSPKKYPKPTWNTQILCSAVLNFTANYERMWVRQPFYQSVSRGCIEKTEHAYKRVAAHWLQMRLSDVPSCHKIVGGQRGIW